MYHEDAEEGGFANKNLPGLQSAVCLAQEVGARLARRNLLQRRLPGQRKVGSREDTKCLTGQVKYG